MQRFEELQFKMYKLTKKCVTDEEKIIWIP